MNFTTKYNIGDTVADGGFIFTVASIGIWYEDGTTRIRYYGTTTNGYKWWAYEENLQLVDA